jgi:serine protease Do
MTEIELIEAYYEKALSPAEMLQFEQKLQVDVAFAERVQQHLAFLQDLRGLRQYNKRKALRATLNNFHEAIVVDNQLAQQQTANPSAVLPLHTAPKPEGKLIGFNNLRKKYFPAISVAASVAAFTAVCTLYAIDYTSAVEKKQLSSYKQLKKEVDNLKNRQRDLEIKENNITKQQEAQIQESRFGGTGFAVAANGCHRVEQNKRVSLQSQFGLLRRSQRLGSAPNK